MEIAEIRQQLKNFIEVANNEKVKAIYTLVEDDLKNHLEYPADLKNQLDAAEEYYKKGGKMVSETEMQYRIEKILTLDS